jgi:hypothetical protein
MQGALPYQQYQIQYLYYHEFDAQDLSLSKLNQELMRLYHLKFHLTLITYQFDLDTILQQPKGHGSGNRDIAVSNVVVNLEFANQYLLNSFQRHQFGPKQFPCA